jgi:hypothetical protein
MHRPTLLRRHPAVGDGAAPVDRRGHGQALVEFAIVIIPFLILLLGVVDLGRGIYQMNTTAEAAREIARVTAVHRWSTCCDLGTSADAQATIATQRSLLPGMVFTPGTDIVCVDISDTVKPDDRCSSGDFVRVRVRSTFSTVTPLLSMFGNHTFESFGRVEVP